MGDQPLLRVRGVHKTFTPRGFLGRRGPAGIQALRGVDLDVARGQVTALLGPNGAGKTTLISIICDLVRADAGSVSVADCAIPDRARQAQRLVGVATTNERSFFWRLTGRQNLEFFAALHGLARPVAARRSTELLTRFGLESHADRLFRTYSAGMKKRLALARAMLHEPPVLLLDEPTTSLDAAGTEDLHDLLRREIVPSGACVVWATHRVEEVRALCDQVIVLVDGEVRFDGATDRFMRRHGSRVGYEIEVGAPSEAVGPVGAYLRSIGAVLHDPLGAGADVGTRVGLPEVRDEPQLSEVLGKCLGLGATIRRVEPMQVSLRQVFANLREEGRPDASGHGSVEGGHA